MLSKQKISHRKYNSTFDENKLTEFKSLVDNLVKKFLIKI